MYIYGDFSAASARLIDIKLVKCHDQDYCKSDEEILDFVANKFMLLMKNQIRWNHEKFGKDSFVKESLMDWVTINTQARVTLPMKASLSEVELQDGAIDLDQVTKIEPEDDLFKIE